MIVMVSLLIFTFSLGCRSGAVYDSRSTENESTEVRENDNTTAEGSLEDDDSSEEAGIPQPTPLPEPNGSGAETTNELFTDLIPSYLSEMCKGSVTKAFEAKDVFVPSYMIKAGSVFFALKYSNTNHTWARFHLPDGGSIAANVPHDSATFECESAAVNSERRFVTNNLTLFYDKELSLEACRVEAGYRIIQRISSSSSGNVGWLHTQSGEDLAIKPGCSAPHLYYERAMIPGFGGRLERYSIGSFYLKD